ncbi:MAG: 5-formyltetrahydrofolate cyclo-ligase [Coriobacteriales bacterium]|nr:5-formyltetrahydrofolate cyclo-ligase [Coriobacteriales bacterium]
MASSYGEDASKQALRSAYMELPTLSPSHKARLDGDILLHLKMLKEYRSCDLVLAFPSQREEGDTLGAIKQARKDGKTVAVPTFDKDGTITFALDDGSTLAMDHDAIAASVCLVPGLIFDAEGYRVAYNAGYIDNFLNTYPGCKVALARTVQISSNPLPRDAHDVAVDVLVSDGAVWRCRK